MVTARLAALVGCAFDEIQESHLQALVDGKVGEDQVLDFKQARYDHGPKGAFEVAKDVAAMACITPPGANQRTRAPIAG